MGDDPIILGLKRSLSRAASKIRLKTRSASRRSGLAAPIISVGSSCVRSISRVPMPRVSRPRAQSGGEVTRSRETKVVVRLPESDRAKKLSRSERRDKKRRRRARKRAQRKNRRRKKR